MRRLIDMKIRTKLLCGFIMVAIFVGVVGFVGITNIRTVDDADTELYENMTLPIQYMGNIAAAFHRVRVNQLYMITTEDDANITEYEKKIEAYSAAISENVSAFENSIRPDDAEMQEAFAVLTNAREEYVPMLEKHAELVRDGKEKEAMAMMHGEMGNAARAEQAAIEELVALNVSRAKAQADSNTETTNRSIIEMLIVIAIAALTALGLGFVIARMISNPVQELVEAADKLALGDMDIKIQADRKDEIGVLMASFAHMAEAVNALVRDAKQLAQAAAEGKLNIRADASKHGGDYRAIIEGVNVTLDAVIEPINEMANVLNEVAQGRLSHRVIGDYQGDNALIKEALNGTVDGLEKLIGEISEALGEISKGNLAIQFDREYKGDFVAISSAIKLIISSLNNVLGDINNASEQVSAGSKQVADSGQALAQGASEQASAIEQLTAAINQIAAQTRQNAANSSQTNDLVINARDNAVGGNDQMKEMLAAMEGINESSNNISKIIKVIDEIAFQTNILALNAAVEAARAGQHGKGFAVVAEEVRNLAARSASAAKETTDLIEGSIRKAAVGTKIANETAAALNQIVDGVSRVVELGGEIAVASNEQATGIAQVNQGIEQVSTVVQSNSASAQESAAASEELSAQSVLLKERVERFKLRRNSRLHHYTERSSNEESNTFREVNVTSAPQLSISLNDQDFGKY
ncbi:MAG: methyl-accepting chemotaxis protein [Bacillota bacterium]|nr:methyl-accepting chemotaxis protein [Bacillota bacterium]